MPCAPQSWHTIGTPVGVAVDLSLPIAHQRQRVAHVVTLDEGAEVHHIGVYVVHLSPLGPDGVRPFEEQEGDVAIPRGRGATSHKVRLRRLRQPGQLAHQSTLKLMSTLADFLVPLSPHIVKKTGWGSPLRPQNSNGARNRNLPFFLVRLCFRARRKSGGGGGGLRSAARAHGSGGAAAATARARGAAGAQRSVGRGRGPPAWLVECEPPADPPSQSPPARAREALRARDGGGRDGLERRVPALEGPRAAGR